MIHMSDSFNPSRFPILFLMGPLGLFHPWGKVSRSVFYSFDAVSQILNLKDILSDNLDVPSYVTVEESDS